MKKLQKRSRLKAEQTLKAKADDNVVDAEYEEVKDDETKNKFFPAWL